MTEQLTFFQVRSLEEDIKDLREEWAKTRKSLYARNANLMQLYLEQRHEIDELKKELHKAA